MPQDSPHNTVSTARRQNRSGFRGAGGIAPDHGIDTGGCATPPHMEFESRLMKQHEISVSKLRRLRRALSTRRRDDFERHE
ncbi:uncharacterized protein MalAC0309_2352 [Microcella alkaliphila]|uniref:Uncharacterized protein n=1 Tax=Microcella alkaliphila TaxID=279828 RepID=A0A0U4WZR5_9MICO|nr:uncharacterized protein MalAC0309_2352 [Microcella alkaliphila]